MSGDLLREASILMRREHGPEHPRHLFWNALADLLAFEVGKPSHVYSRDALAVARAYLGRDT